MLCKYCSNIDLDALVSKEGYKHHASCADLIKSSRDGCNSCSLIRNTGNEPGVDLTNEYDVGPLDTQIVARVVFETPGNYNKIQFCQETPIAFWMTKDRIVNHPRGCSPTGASYQLRRILTVCNMRLCLRWLTMVQTISCRCIFPGDSCYPDRPRHGYLSLPAVSRSV
jgi:hypothetical protein